MAAVQQEAQSRWANLSAALCIAHDRQPEIDHTTPSTAPSAAQSANTLAQAARPLAVWKPWMVWLSPRFKTLPAQVKRRQPSAVF